MAGAGAAHGGHMRIFWAEGAILHLDGADGYAPYSFVKTLRIRHFKKGEFHCR